MDPPLRSDSQDPTSHDRTPAQLSRHLGISRDAIYTWIHSGHLPSRHGPGGRTYVPFTTDIETACWQRIARSPQLPADVKARALHHVTGDAL
jgi:predicted DNA-binding transcriptional regulator AlpA